MQYLHTMIRVGNLESALDFFCDKLGFIKTNQYDHEEGRFSLVFLAASDDANQAKEMPMPFQTPVIELTYNWDESEYSEGNNFGHLAYRVDNIYALCQQLMDKGVTINRPPRDGYMAFIKSPDGISIELLQKGNALPPQEPWSSMENTGNW